VQACLLLQGSHEITATLTAAAANRLGLVAGMAAVAQDKASAVMLVTDFDGYALSARNQLAGTISRIESGGVASLVGLRLPGGATVTASVTNEAVTALGLNIGQPATAVGVQGQCRDAGRGRRLASQPGAARCTGHARQAITGAESPWHRPAGTPA
jgi:molybdopterin-binding protein